MADSPDAAVKGAGSFLTKKIGPLPMFVWLGAGLVLYLYFERKQSKSTTAAPNQQTDPAGNVGSIDPATGYVYGTPEDTAALAAQNSGTSTDTGSAGSSGTTGVPTYTDNNAWGIAAINLLVGRGIDAATANQAIELYLSSQPLTTEQQADVNQAIQALGPPPSLPGPVSGNPSPVTTPGGTGSGSGTGHNGGHPPHVPVPPNPPKKTPPPPTGLVVASKKSTTAVVKWNKASGATSYHVLCTDMATKKITTETNTSGLTITLGGLTPSHSYVVDVWSATSAQAKAGSGAHAEVSFTTPRTG